MLYKKMNYIFIKMILKNNTQNHKTYLNKLIHLSTVKIKTTNYCNR